MSYKPYKLCLHTPQQAQIGCCMLSLLLVFLPAIAGWYLPACAYGRVEQFKRTVACDEWSTLRKGDIQFNFSRSINLRSSYFKYMSAFIKKQSNHFVQSIHEIRMSVKYFYLVAHPSSGRQLKLFRPCCPGTRPVRTRPPGSGTGQQGSRCNTIGISGESVRRHLDDAVGIGTVYSTYEQNHRPDCERLTNRSQ